MISTWICFLSEMKSLLFGTSNKQYSRGCWWHFFETYEIKLKHNFEIIKREAQPFNRKKFKFLPLPHLASQFIREHWKITRLMNRRADLLVVRKCLTLTLTCNRQASQLLMAWQQQWCFSLPHRSCALNVSIVSSSAEKRSKRSMIRVRVFSNN